MNTTDFGNAPLLRDRAYEAIRTAIITGRTKPGEKLNISDFAKQMNTSFAPVREALNMLSRDGLVELMPHKQPVVTTGDYDDYLTTVNLRILLEPYAARLTYANIPQEKIDEVRMQLNTILSNPDDLDAYISSDIALHKLLYSYAKSPLLTTMLNMLTSYNMRYRYLNNIRGDTAQNIMSMQEHIDIIDALDSRDPDRIFYTVRGHIERYNARNILTAQAEFGHKA